MILAWNDILPAAIASLSPLRQEIVMCILRQPGRRPSYAHALRTWKLDRKQFDMELETAFDGIRRYLRRYGIAAPSDLVFTCG